MRASVRTYADGVLGEGGDQFEVRFSAANQVHREAAAGAPFNVYFAIQERRAAIGTE